MAVACSSHSDQHNASSLGVSFEATIMPKPPLNRALTPGAQVRSWEAAVL